MWLPNRAFLKLNSQWIWLFTLLLPYFPASSKVLRSPDLKRSWRPSKCISVLMRKPHIQGAIFTQLEKLRKIVFFSLSVDWHLDINQRICSATWLEFLLLLLLKIKQNKSMFPPFWRTRENASWILKSGDQLCLTAPSLGYGAWNPDVPRPNFWDYQSLGNTFFLSEIGK